MLIDMWPFNRNRPRKTEVNTGEQIIQKTQLRITQDDKIRNLIRSELLRQAMGKVENETFEEADDFDMEDEEWASPYEETFDPGPADPTPPEPTPAPGAAPEPVKPSDSNEPSV